jgi:competence protein ComGC
MKKSYFTFILLFISIFLIAATSLQCMEEHSKTKADSGVEKVIQKVSVQANGKTLEQDNVAKRLELENKPGSIQHLYVMSAYSGQVLLYSTVKGKVTSSGKRLSPTILSSTYTERYNPEIIGDDGTYGNSIEYL